MEYSFLVKGDRLRLINVNNGVVGNYNSYECEFIFERGTQGLTWFAVFTCGDSVYERLIVNNKCTVPNDVINKAGIIYIGIYGIETAETVAKRIVTNMCFISLRVGAYRDSYDMPDMCKEYTDEIATYKAQIDDEIAKVREECDNKAVKEHRHLTSEVYLKAVVAYDMSGYMGGWENDGIAVGVWNKQEFLALDKLYFTYKGSAIEVKPSSFTDWNCTAGDAWGPLDGGKYDDLYVFVYNGDEFDVSTNEQAALDPIYKEIILSDKLSDLSYSLSQKAGRASTLSGYGINDAYTKEETDILINDKVNISAAGTYCKYNLVAGVTSQLCVAAAYPVPGVSKYALVVNDKLIGDITALGKPLKIASMLTTATNAYLCFMTSRQIPVYYAQLSDNIKNDKFTAGILTFFEPTNPWIPDEIDDSGSIDEVPVIDDVFE